MRLTRKAQMDLGELNQEQMHDDKRKAALAAPTGSPALPNGLTRFEAIEGLRELRNDAVAAEKLKDPSFVRWPDLDAILDHIEKHGFPAPENTDYTKVPRP